MIYLTEGAKINGLPVHHIHLKDLYHLFSCCQKKKKSLVIQDINLENGCVLKALPIHIDTCDIPYLNYLPDMRSILAKKATFIIATQCSEDDMKKIYDMTPLDIINYVRSVPQNTQEAHHHRHHHHKTFWLIFSASAFVMSLILSAIALNEYA